MEKLAEKMTKKGGLKYAFDRQGKLVLIQQTQGIQRQAPWALINFKIIF